MNFNLFKMFGFLLFPLHLAAFWFGHKYVGFNSAIVLTGVSLVCFFFFYTNKARKLRLKFIDDYVFPSVVIKKFMAEYPHLSSADIHKVGLALKQFFKLFALTKDGGKKPKKGFLMPSKIADELWHNFMLDSVSYEKFCKTAFGEMFHHKPGLPNSGNKNMRSLKTFSRELINTKDYIYRLEKDNLHLIAGVPILFAIDSHLKIVNGFYYDTEVMANIPKTPNSATLSSSPTGACGGILTPQTAGSCDGGSSGSCGGGCGGGCGGD